MHALSWPGNTILALVVVCSLSACGESGEVGPVGQGSVAISSGEPVAPVRINTFGFPLEGVKYQASALTPPAGTSFAHGMLILTNRGRTQLRLDKVTPIDVGEGLRHLGVRVAGLDRTIGFRQSTDWPITSPDLGATTLPEGLIIEPETVPEAERGYEILLGYQVVGAGRATVKGVRVEYTDLGDGSRHSVDFRDTLSICPGLVVKKDCPIEEGL